MIWDLLLGTLAGLASFDCSDCGASQKNSSDGNSRRRERARSMIRSRRHEQNRATTLVSCRLSDCLEPTSFELFEFSVLGLSILDSYLSCIASVGLSRKTAGKSLSSNLAIQTDARERVASGTGLILTSYFCLRRGSGNSPIARGRVATRSLASHAAFSLIFHWMACWISSRPLRRASFSLMWAW